MTSSPKYILYQFFTLLNKKFKGGKEKKNPNTHMHQYFPNHAYERYHMKTEQDTQGR